MGLPALYTLSVQHQQLSELATDDDLDEHSLQAIRDTLDGLEGDLEAKGRSVAAVVLSLEAWAKAAQDASKALRERATRIDRRADALRNYMLAQLQAAGITKIEGAEFTVAIRKNPPSVQVSPDADLGDEWMVFHEPPPPTPDKRKIGDALKAGQEIRGCSLSQTVRLDIRS